MKIIYEGVDIYDKVSVESCIHDMYSGEKSDSIVIRFNDTKGLWNAWDSKYGDTIEIEEGAAKSGKMFVANTKPENGLFTIRAMAMPPSGETIKSRSWEAVRLLQIGNQIAQEHNLIFKYYGVKDQVYPYLSQNSQTDFEFLQERCQLEGCAITIYNGALIMYDEQYIESQEPVGEIKIGADGVFAYMDNSSMAYGSAEVNSGEFDGKFVIENNDRIFRPRKPIKVTSNAEAARYAKALLRLANKNNCTGWFKENLLPGYAAASVVRIKTDRRNLWDGPVFVAHIRHDYISQKSKVFFRRLLEGY
jgi:hypothetical protein